MAACDMVTSSATTYGHHQATLVHIPSSADQSSPLLLSNGTMGSTSSLLADSGYRGYSDTTTNSNSSVFDDPPAPNDDTESIGPPKLTPISGKLEKTKEKKLIKPIAVRFASPNTSPTETYNKISQSPSLSDTMATYAHPPDILMSNHNHGFSAGKHFGKPPTKTMSLQDITPPQQPYRMNGHRGSNGNGNAHQKSLSPPPPPIKGESSQRSALHLKLQQAQSLNFLNRGGWGNHGGMAPGKIGTGGGRHRSHSQSTYPGDGQRPLQATHAQDFKQHSHPNLISPRANEEHVYAPVSVSSVPEEDDLAEENRILRNKVQDMKHQLVTMRDTMEVNEQTIFQVQEEKRRDYEGRITRLQNQLQLEKESSHSQQRSQQQEIYRLEQDRKHLKSKLEEMQKDISKLQDSGKKVEEQKTVIAESQQEITNKRYEIKRLEESVKHSKEELQYEKENVMRLQIELDKTKLQVTKRNNAGHQQLLSKKDSEITQMKSDVKKMMDQRDSLMLRVKNQGEEIDRLGVLVKTREQELAQERCEVSYLKEVNERMSSALKVKDDKVEKTKGRDEAGNVNSEKIDVVKLELDRTVEKLQQLQIEKDMESARHQKRIAEKEVEIKRLQGRFRDRAKAIERSGPDQKNNPAQRQLEQDKLELQAKVVKREQELKQARQQLLVLQTQERHTGPALSNSILQKKEAELKACQEKLHQRHAEITYIREKLGERDAELTALKVKLDRVHRQNPENGRRSGSLDRELSGTRAAKQQLESQVKTLQEENARLKDKLSRVAVGVRTLSESHMNLAKLSMAPSVPEKPKFERTDPKAMGQLQKEVANLKQEISRLKEDREKQTAHFRREHGIWQEEKHRVIAYQKQLQLNYVQMCQKNKKLDQEVQQLTNCLPCGTVL